MQRACLVLWGALALVAPAHGEAAASPAVAVVTVTQPPVLDGNLAEACWRGATHVEGFFFPTENKASAERTEAWICRDALNIYVAIYAHDTRPAEISSQQTVRNGSLDRDDYVAFHVDPTAKGVEHYEFRVSANGTQSDSFPQSGSDNYAWKGTWTAGARRVEDGYCVELAVPFAALHYPSGQTTFQVGFMRYLQREREASYWPEMRDRYEGYALGRWGALALASHVTRPLILPYGEFRVNDHGISLQGGLDARHVFANGLTALATLNPDFKNVQDVVDSISFSYTARSLSDNRPFFAEGSGYFPVNTMWYSRAVPSIIAGAKSFGRLGNQDYGILGTLSDRGRLDGVANYSYRLAPYTHAHVDVGAAWRDSPRDPTNVVTTAKIHWIEPLGTASVDNKVELYHSLTTGPGGDGNAWNYVMSYGGNGLLGVNASYQYVNPAFRSLDGYIPDPDIRGYSLGAWGGLRTQDWWIQNHSWSCYHNEYRKQDGHTLSTEWGADGAARVAGGYNVYARVRRGQRPPSHDMTGTLGFQWGLESLGNDGGVEGTLGGRGGADYAYATAWQNWKPTKALGFGASSEYTYRYFALHDQPTVRRTQTIVSAGYTLNDYSSVSARFVERHGRLNLFLAYRLAPLSGRTLYVYLGDPNADRTQAQFQVKVNWPL